MALATTTMACLPPPPPPPLSVSPVIPSVGHNNASSSNDTFLNCDHLDFLHPLEEEEEDGEPFRVRRSDLSASGVSHYLDAILTVSGYSLLAKLFGVFPGEGIRKCISLIHLKMMFSTSVAKIVAIKLCHVNMSFFF